jgi:outer membrane protein assembly factor BamB
MMTPQLLAPSRGRWLALGGFERDVELWDLVAERRLSRFQTLLDAGGSRLVLSSDGQRCFAAAYRTGGLAAYDAHSGEVAWARPDLSKIPSIACSFDDRSLLVASDDGAISKLSASDGSTVATLPGVLDLFDAGPRGALHVLGRSRAELELHAPSGVVHFLPKTTFEVLAVAFGPDSVCISEASGAVRCFDVGSAQPLWRFDPPPSEHVVRLAYCAEAAAFRAVSFEYAASGSKKLLALAEGKAAPLAILGKAALAEFCLDGERLVLSDGRMLGAARGDERSRLDFATSERTS